MKPVGPEIPKICKTCKFKDSPCDWCFFDPEGADNWVWDGEPWPRAQKEMED